MAVPSYGQGAPPPARGNGKWIATVLFLAIGAGLLLTLPRYLEQREIRAYRAELKSRKEALERWKGWLRVGTCARRDDGAHFVAAIEKQLGDPTSEALRDATSGHPLVDPSCSTGLPPAATGDELSDSAKAIITEWLSANRTISKAKKPDLEQLRRQLEARDRVLAKVRKTLVPEVHAQIRKVQALHDTRRDYQWWRIELGFKLEEVFEKARLAHSAGQDVAAAVGSTLKQIEDARERADKEVGLRQIHGLAMASKASSEQAWTAVSGIDDNGFWSALEDDNAVFGMMPPEPQGCDISL